MKLSDDDPLPISLVAHHVFCPRRAWLEAAGETSPSSAVEIGLADSATVDTGRGATPGRQRSVDVGSTHLGVVGRCDTLLDDDGAVIVVEHKATPKRRSMTVTPATRVQLALQGMALEEADIRVAGYAVWFSTHRRRVDVAITEADTAEARRQVQQTRDTVRSPHAPQPLVDDRRCASCSHVGVCLPDERHEVPGARVIAVRDPCGEVVHVGTPGARCYLRTGRMRVDHRHDTIRTLPIERVDALVVHGNVDLSGALTRELLWRRRPIVWLSGRGRLIGWAHTAESPNGLARHHQHRVDAVTAFSVAQAFVAAKIANQATILRRLGDAPAAVKRMRRLQRRATEARDVLNLLGSEGEAAALYFGAFSTMLSERVRSSGIGFDTRSRRPARDPVNAALNYAYGLLLAEAVRAAVACGLDPSAGFLHTPTRNKPAFALDLMEEFRPHLADAVVIGAFNNGELHAQHFTDVLGATRFRDDGRRALIAAFERRMATQFTHPVFGYRVSWRRALEVQARMVLGVVDGTQPAYIGITVR